jgi:hypothetical protein
VAQPAALCHHRDIRHRRDHLRAAPAGHLVQREAGGIGAGSWPPQAHAMCGGARQQQQQPGHRVEQQILLSARRVGHDDHPLRVRPYRTRGVELGRAGAG